MIAETALVCWLVAYVFLPLLWALTSSPPAEVRRVTNALVRQRAQLIADDPVTKITVTPAALGKWRAARDAGLLNYRAPVTALDLEEAA